MDLEPIGGSNGGFGDDDNEEKRPEGYDPNDTYMDSNSDLSENPENENDANESDLEEVDELVAPNDDDDNIDDQDDDASLESLDNSHNQNQTTENFDPEEGFVAQYKFHSESVYAVKFNKDGSQFASGGGDDVAYIGSVPATSASSSKTSISTTIPTASNLMQDRSSFTSSYLHKLSGHTDTIISVSYNHDFSLLATASYDATIRIYNVNGSNSSQNRSPYSLVLTLDGPSSEIEWMEWHPKGNVVAAGSADTTAWLWEINEVNHGAGTTSYSSVCLAVFGGHEGAVNCGTFTPNGKRLVTGSEDGTVKVWAPNVTPNLVHTFSDHAWRISGSPIVCLVFSGSDATVFATGSQDGKVVVSKIDMKKDIATFRDTVAPRDPTDKNNSTENGEDSQMSACSIESLVFCNGAGVNLLVSGSNVGSVKVWDLVSQTLRHTLLYTESIIKIKNLTVGNGLKTLVACGDGKLSLVDVRSGKIERDVVVRHRDMILDFDVLTSSSQIANESTVLIITASDDKTSRVVQLKLN